MNTDTNENTETNIRVGFEILGGSPGRWAWEVSGKNGYGWGTAQSEREAMLDCIAYLQINNL